ncbi:MAG: D-lyxose/D-mannose family sugar isomerase [Trueperaceae bacterium]|nr:D-lyxose/D-mannose family sugar isomerase [Trueperaceae bacterium]
MRRSEINAAIRDAERILRDAGVHLPPFAGLTPADWAAQGADLEGARRPGLGWDVTDFGLGRFARVGLTLVTLRNGQLAPAPDGPPDKPYAEKLLLIGDGQRTPMHAHVRKTEDIIHRGGVGRLVLELRSSAAPAEPRGEPLTVWTDGRARTLAPAERLVLHAGESVTLVPGCYHAFWAEGGTVVAGEVSSVNDDATDNVFVEPIGRFADVDEDEAPYRLLVSDYAALRPAGAEEGTP